MSKTKIIIITSVSTVLTAGTIFYFLVWRKRKGVSKEDAEDLKQYKVVQQEHPDDSDVNGIVI